MATYGRRRRHEGAVVRVDLNGLLPAAGPGAGIDPGGLGGLLDELNRLGSAVGFEPSSSTPARLPSSSDLRPIVGRSAEIRSEFKTVVVLGSAAEVAASAILIDALRGELRGGRGCRVLLADSADPGAMEALLGQVDLRTTAFNVVTASGGEPETVAQFLVVRDRLLRELGGVAYRRHVVVTTDGGGGALRQIVNDEGFRDLALTPTRTPWTPFDAVTLFPAAVAGIDIEDVVAGAVLADERGSATGHPLGDPANALAAALWWRGGRELSGAPAVLAYCERLAAAADWFAPRWRQLAGLRGAMTLFLRVEDHGTQVRVPAAYQDLAEIRYLGGHSLGALVNAEQHASEMSLALQGRPSATITLPVVSAFTMGQLLRILGQVLGALKALGGGTEDECQIDDVRGLLPGFLAEGAADWVARKNPRLIV